jgi:hypothetical protein
MHPTLDLHSPATQRARDTDENLVVLERLDDVPVGTYRQRGFGYIGIIGSRHNDRCGVVRVVRNLHEEIQSGATGQVHVRQ